MKKRWINLYVENEPGVLALIAGLFSGKSYNLESLTVGPAEDETVSRMTIGLTSDDQTFEQIKNSSPGVWRSSRSWTLRRPPCTARS